MGKDDKTIFDTGQTIPDPDSKASDTAKTVYEANLSLDELLSAALEEAKNRAKDQDGNDRDKSTPDKTVSEDPKPLCDDAKTIYEASLTLDDVLGAALEEAINRAKDQEGDDRVETESDKNVPEDSKTKNVDTKIEQEVNLTFADPALDDVAERADEVLAGKIAIRKGETLLDTYRVESDAIEGGMGAVWRVHHGGWNVDLAMKRPKPGFFQSEKQKENFVRECESWINLGLHPHIVSCYYVREIDQVPSIFSEWMDGGSLKNAIENGSLYDEGAAERILDIAIQFARGLRYAHEQGLIHQDVKPDNLLLTKDWDAKVADFGLVKARAVLTVLDGDISTDATMFSAAGGYTPAYCSMEQMNGEALTRRTDIYSWAVSVLEMYLGDRPWQNGVIAGAACETYFPDAKVAIPQKMQDLLQKCLTAEETNRPHDFAEVEKNLLEIYREETNREYPRPVPDAAADTADSLNNRALSFLDIGHPEQAVSCWEQALKIEPNHMDSTYNQALYLWRNGEIDDLEAANRIPVAEGQQAWKNPYMKALIHLERLAVKRAVGLLEEAKALSDNKQVQEAQAAAIALMDQDISGRIKKMRVKGIEGLENLAVNAVLPDGRVLLSLKSRNELWLFKPGKSDPVQKFSIGSSCTAFHLLMDGTGFVTGNADGAVMLWSWDSGQRLRTIMQAEGEIRSLDLAEGDRLMVAIAPNIYSLIDLSSDGVLFTRQVEFESTDGMKPRSLYDVRVSPDCKRALFTSITGDNWMLFPELWDLEHNSCIRKYTRTRKNVFHDTNVSDDFTQFLGANHDGRLILWDIETNRLLLQFPDEKYDYIAFFGERYFIVIPYGLTTRNQIWDRRTGKCLHTLDLKTSHFATCAEANLLVLYSLNELIWYALPDFTWRAGYMLSRVQSFTERRVEEEQFNHAMTQAEAAYRQGAYADALKALDEAYVVPGYRQNPRQKALRAKLGQISRKTGLLGYRMDIVVEHANFFLPKRLEASADGRYVLIQPPESSGLHDRIALWDVQAEKVSFPLQRVPAINRKKSSQIDQQPGLSVALALGGEAVVYQDFEWGGLSLLYLPTGFKHPLKGTENVFQFCVFPDQKHLMTYSYDENKEHWFCVWKLCEPEWLGKQNDGMEIIPLMLGKNRTPVPGIFKSLFNLPYSGFAVSLDGKYLLVAYWGRTELDLVEIGTGKVVHQFKGVYEKSKAWFSPDGQYVLSFVESNSPALWKVGEEKPCRVFKGHEKTVNSAAFSSDGLFIASASNDGTVRIWDVEMGTCQQILRFYAEGVTDCCFSPDGGYLYSTPLDSTFRTCELIWQYTYDADKTVDEAINCGEDNDGGDRDNAMSDKTVSEDTKPLHDDAKTVCEANLTLDDVLGAALEEAKNREKDQEGNDRKKAMPDKTVFEVSKPLHDDVKTVYETNLTLDDVLGAALDEAKNRAKDQDGNDREKAIPDKTVPEGSKPLHDDTKTVYEANLTLDDVLGAALEEAKNRERDQDGNDQKKAIPDKTVSEDTKPLHDAAKTVYEANLTLDDVLGAALEEAKNRAKDQDGNDQEKVTPDKIVSEDTKPLHDDVTGEVPIGNAFIRKGETLLNIYRVESDAIEGGMGAVWRVHHIGWNVDLAMKRPKPGLFQTEKQKDNFVRECESWINLGLHPHIVSCYYVREIDHVPTIFSEWMDGGSLKTAIANGSLYEEDAAERILDIAIQFARGLHYSHEQGLIHQDVKPDNLLLTKDWDAKVADFGLAKARAVLTALEADLSADATMFSAAGGYTPAYCSMEQMNGETLTRRTDIYSWAVSVLEMYLGDRPWQNGVIAGAACEAYFPTAKIVIPQKMQDLLRECLMAEEEDRPHDFSEVEKRLLEIYREETNEDYSRPVSDAAANSADSLNNRALSLIDLNKGEEALDTFQHIFDHVDPTHLEAWFNYSLLRYFSEKITRTDTLATIKGIVRTWEQLDKKQATWKSSYYLGLIRELTGDRRAVADLERALIASGDNADVAAALERVKKGSLGEGQTIVPRRRNDLPWQITRIVSTDVQILRMQAIAKVEETVDRYLALYGPDEATAYLNEAASKIKDFDKGRYEKINDRIGRYGVPGKPHDSFRILSLATKVLPSCIDFGTNLLIYGAHDRLTVFFPDEHRCYPLQFQEIDITTAVGLSGNDRIAAIAFRSKTNGYFIAFYGIKEERIVGFYPFPTRIISVQFSLKDSEIFALGDDRGDTTIWRMGEASPVKKIRSAAMSRFNRNGDLLVYDDTWLEKRLVLLSVPDGKKLLRYDRIEKSPPTAIDICPSGRFAVSAMGHEIIVWDQDGHVKETVLAGNDPVTALCCCSDNRHFYSGDSKGLIKLWNVAPLVSEWDISDHTEAISSLCSSADMRYIASTARDGRFATWKLIWNYQNRSSGS